MTPSPKSAATNRSISDQISDLGSELELVTKQDGIDPIPLAVPPGSSILANQLLRTQRPRALPQIAPSATR